MKIYPFGIILEPISSGSMMLSEEIEEIVVSVGKNKKCQTE
jgi:hypothetical protein